MSLRPEIKPYLAITNAAMTANILGSATIVQKLSIVSYQFVWTAGSTPSGTVGVQVSNDFAISSTGAVSVAGTWSTYWFLNSSGSTVTTLTVSGNTGNAYIELPNIGSYAVRPIFTFTSGNGTLNVTLNAKVA